ncbi:MAG: glycosyltransferase family 9 protein [bacterium]
MLNIKLKKVFKIIVSQLLYILVIVKFRFKKKNKSTNKTLLIIKLDAIGDYVLFRNFLEEIRTSSTYKDYKITFLGNSVVKDLSETLDKAFVDEFIWIKKRNVFKNPLSILKIADLIYNKFNTTIHATYSREFIGDLLVKLSGSETRIGFYGDCNNISEKEKNKTNTWYTKLVPIDPKINFEFYKNKSFFSQILNSELIIKKPYIDLKNLQISTPPILPSNFVLLFPGAQQNFRRWPADKFQSIANYLINKYNLDIVICGSKSDSALANIINPDDNKRIFDLTGKTSLTQLIFIISKAKLVISNDTSGAHIGAALDIPTIILSQFNHYMRFVPYPSEISDKMFCLLPHIFDTVPQNELIEKFKLGSDVDISLISIDDVKEAIIKTIL